MDGLITIASNFDPKETMDRLEEAIRGQKMTVFARIDHAVGAAAVGLTLRPTNLIIFGNAQGGTPLMQMVPTIGIDLPLKAMVWKDEGGQTWLSYNLPDWIVSRHHIADAQAIVTRMTDGLSRIASKATTRPAV